MSHASTHDKLARMANQIATFFRSYPDEEAIAGIRDHIVAFWSPRMRSDLAEAIDGSDLAIDPLVVSAFRTGSTAHNPTDRAIADANVAGELASDAG